MLIPRKNNKVTFWLKENFTCPVCREKFDREEIRLGGGRMNAGDLSDELHRFYIPTKKYGEIHPLIYTLMVCPSCYYAVYPKDFADLSPAVQESINRQTELRKEKVEELFPDVDFTKKRTLTEGIASYAAALFVYDLMPQNLAPSFKQALSALRAAWLCKHLAEKEKGKNYDYLALVFYRKASFFYENSLNQTEKGKEYFDSVDSFGPDIDQNYGFDSLIYLTSLLRFKYGQKTDKDLYMKTLEQSRVVISRLVGLGKASRSKPSVLLHYGRDLFETLKNELKRLEEEKESGSA